MAAFRAPAFLAAVLILPACLEGPSSIQEELPAPSGLLAVALADGAAIQLSWTDHSSSESSFRIDVSDVPIVAASDVTEWTTVPADTTAYTYAASPQVTRYFRVLAITPFQQSAPSNVAHATTPDVPPAPGRLDTLVGPDDPGDDVTLGWDDVANETAYEVQRSNDGTHWYALVTLGQNSTSYVDPTTHYTFQYAYRVRGTNAIGAGAWASSVWARTRSLSWERLSASTVGDTSWNLSLAVNAGVAVVAAYNSTYGDLAHGSTFGGNSTFNSTTINPGFPGSLGFGSTSIAMDGAGRSHIVAVDAFRDTLYHVTDQYGGIWQADAIDSAVDDAKAIVRTAPDGTLRVVYQQETGFTRGLRHAVRSGSTWISEGIMSADSTDYFDFAIDSSGVSHVVYRRSVGTGVHQLVHARRAPHSGWEFSSLVSQADPEMCSLTTDASNQLYVAYNSIVTGALHLLTNAGGAWVEETVHRSPRGSWGRYNSLVIGDRGEIHLAYYDNLHGALRYAGRLPGQPWRLQLVDSVGDVGRYASIGRDPHFGLFIAYGDASNGRMKVAKTCLRAPTGLRATLISSSRIDVIWDDTPNETAYQLHRSRDGGASWTVVANLPVDVTSYSDTGVISPIGNIYRVIATNEFGVSPIGY